MNPRMQLPEHAQKDRATEDDEHDAAVDELPYRDIATIDPMELTTALNSLVLLGDDPYLRMQVVNLAIVDPFLMDLETAAFQSLFDEDKKYGPELVFLSAQSQMWMFAAYELLRTWRERAREVRRWISENSLQAHINDLQRDIGYENFGRNVRAGQLRRAFADPDFASG